MKVFVVVAGVAGWGLALVLIATNRTRERVEPSDLPDASTRERALSMVARIGGSVAGAMFAGLLVVGFGGRLMMRLLAATSPASVQGRITDADEIVGEVTADGTIGFIIFNGIFVGLAGLALFSLLRRWLPRRSVFAGLVTGAIGSGLLAGPTGALDRDNHDFEILSPVWLAVVVIVALFATFGALGGVLIDRWARTWPRPTSIRGVLGLLPMVPLFLFGVPGVVLVAVGLFGVFLAPGLRRAMSKSGIDRFGRVAVLVAGVIGGAVVLVSGGQILLA